MSVNFHGAQVTNGNQTGEKKYANGLGLENHYISLPHQVDPVPHFALDIGGSLVKMVYFEDNAQNGGNSNGNSSTNSSSETTKEETIANTEAQAQEQTQIQEKEGEDEETDNNRQTSAKSPQDKKPPRGRKAQPLESHILASLKRRATLQPELPSPLPFGVRRSSASAVLCVETTLSSTNVEASQQSDDNCATTITASPTIDPDVMMSPSESYKNSIPEVTSGGKLVFAKFETANIEECITFIETLDLNYGPSKQKTSRIHATGGGSYKFNSLLKERLNTELVKIDEMQSLILGLNFLLINLPNESYTFLKGQKEYVPPPDQDDMYPYLLVNIGSGVSIIRVDGFSEYERISGSSLGGGTFYGLCRLLTDGKSFEEVLELATKGDNRNIDMLVGDIYGHDYTKVGLSSDTIASSIGKAAWTTESDAPINKEDVAKSLLYMISNNISQIAYLNAMRFNIKRIYFAGHFIAGHPTTMATISYGINFWSRGTAKALFLKHEGYLGALGAFIADEN